MEAKQVFQALKEALVKPLVLALLDSTLSFEIECDVLRSVVAIISMQRGHPIAHYSQALKERALHLSTYEK